VRYHKEDLADDNNINGGDFIDDDALMQRFPPGTDVTVTSFPVRTAGGENLPVTSKRGIIKRFVTLHYVAAWCSG